MAAEIVQIDTQNLTSQIYGEQDVSLISSLEVNTSLSSSSYIEYFIYDNNQNLLSSDYNFKEYAVVNDGQSAGNNGDISQIVIDPEASLINYGFDQGEYITYFNFLNKQIGSDLQQLYITEISSDRTEIRLDSTSLTDIDIVEQTNNLIVQRENSPYFLDFYLNFGDNQLPIANNIQLDNTDPSNPTILIKLYEALPEEFDLNSTLWVVTLVEEPIAYKVTFEDEIFTISDTIPVKGPNFNLDLKDQVNNSTVSYDYSTLTTTTLTSSQNQLRSLLEEKEIDINVDYTDFNNFIHFSSVQTRLENFYYKVGLIEQYSSSIATLNNATNSPSNISSSKTIYESKISDIITNFDGYDYYLYYSSGSWAWPKTTSNPPYALAKTNSLAVSQWFGSSVEGETYYGGISLSASNFDNLNQNNLYYAIPEYLRNDSSNDQYQLFIEMVGQFYDNIWIYYKDVTEKYNADNRLENGISKDIVADAIRDFGIKLYQNNFSNEDLYTAFLGLTPDGALFPFPNITGSLPTPTGFEYVDTLISASNDYMPLDDVNKSLYKRIYHNLPYLLKAKGTLPALRTLITSYGIPDTILRINEYGGKDKVNSNDWDYWQNEFNYSILTDSISPCVATKFNALNNLWGATNETPEAVMLRFKLATTDHKNGDPSETVFKLNTDVELSLLYTGSGLSSGSYSGSIIDPYYQYASLNFYPDPSDLSISASVYLPFYNQDWWSVMINAVHNGSNIDYTLYAANKVYEGGDNGTELGFFTSSSVSSPKDYWIDSNQALYGRPMSGSFQEIRYYVNPISESVFKDYVMNPSSIEGNSLNSGPNELAFRASLGGELYTGSVSIHPKVTGSWETTSSFDGDSGFEINSIFTPNTEYFFYDQPIAGIKNAISDKIRLENDTLPAGDTLSSIRALSQQPSISSSYTANTNLLEVAFSPQDEINEDIMDQIGYLNIGEFIGDPRLRSSSAESYPALDNLRNAYFEKYTKNYDLNDFMRLIKFFDNSLFKMIKDFVPARTSLASGVVIKQHILERNKYPQPQVNWTNVTYTGSINSTQIWNPITQENEISHSLIETFSGGTGGSFERFNYVGNTEQSWTESINTLSGSVLVIHSSQDEFYDGEFSGSMITVTTQSLNTPYPLDNQDFNYTPVVYSTQNYNLSLADTLAETQFLNPLTIPSPGQILMLDNWINLTISGITSGASYIKIHKFDNNGVNNSTVIGQITKLLIKLSVYSFYSEINILSINEFPTYYLCEVNTIPTQDDYIKNYKVSASFTSSTFQFNSLSDTTLFPYQPSPVNTNIFNQFNTSSGIYTSPGTPNILLSITASITTSGSAGSIWTLIKNGVSLLDGNTPGSSQIVQPSGSNITRTLSGSFFALDGDIIQLVGYRDGSGFSQIVKSGSLLITQSIAPSAQEYDSVIFEPYITTPNYYNSDNNPTINNINNDRLSTIYEDVDYSTGITTPQNFSLIISGSALKAAVQDSNYTSKRVTIPRYDGSKSTSQYLNIWTPGDEGTYGKLPTVESLKTTVAYCDFIGGYPPERMNASGAHILYLINADGTVSIPNTTPNSLQNVQGNFLTGERFEVNTKGLGTQNTPYRTIIRGGSLIKPILYTQIGHTPANWTSSLNLINSNIQSNITNITVISNINEIATFGGSNIAQQFTSNQETLGNKDNLVPSDNSGWNVTYDNGNYRQGNGDYYYLVPSAAITQGIDIIVDSNIVIYNPSYNSMTVQVTLKRFRGGGETNLQVQTITFGTGETKIVPFYVTLKPQIDILTNDQLYITIRRTTSLAPGNSDGYVLFNGTYFNIQQNPLPNPLPSASVATGSVWNYPTSSTYNQASSSNAGIIFMPLTSSILNVYYDVEGVRQQDITGSGFNPIDTDWSVQIGDEFRFEGREDRTFMVNKVFPPTLSSPERISNTGSLEVHLDSSIPSASINLDHFLIRRYTDDASFISFEGFKPSNSTGPYIIKPEFVVPELDKDIDSFILDLTQKGLIT
jgi:hypothetical protein